MLGKKNADTKMSTLIGAGAELTGDLHWTVPQELTVRLVVT